ncbi:FHA domain-containing protein [Sphaerisporangium aureirubrum]|uniref:FHA domain-containing protein n=1 Tax=Sphaerisporangium aureirubrum TaxID=1544736 RepID=A0ABW1NNH8_9ACTN
MAEREGEVGMGLESSVSATTRVTGPSGRTVEVAEGMRLVFGRGADADLMLPGDRGLSRRAGVVTALRDGAWVANMSCTHALYVESDGHRIRLPRLKDGEEPSGGWFMRRGTALVGSGAMLDDGQPLRVVVTAREPEIDLRAEHSGPRAKGDSTLLPLYLDPMTKLFLVALLWCRPWLVDPTRTTPLPRTPEIAQAALEVTDASYELERFSVDPAFRDRLSARVGEHIKVLRRKIVGRGLARAGSRLSDEVVVGVLLEHEIITLTDLARLDDPVWCSRQEDLWWSGMP